MASKFLYCTPIAILVDAVLPPSVIHESKIVEVAVTAVVVATPEVRVELAMAVVKAGRSGLETVHELVPVVTHAMEEEAPDETGFGVAESASAG